jgi:predicted Fe-Mo cluster-binding NifX family protein
MKICLPTNDNLGLQSELASNFSAANWLLVVESETQETRAIDMSDEEPRKRPVDLDVIVCAGGIGRGMFNGLRSRGIQVFSTDAMTVNDALAELAAGSLIEVAEVECCGGGHHEQGEAHGHDCACGSAGGESEKSGCGCSHH